MSPPSFSDPASYHQVEECRLEELALLLEDPVLDSEGGIRRVVATIRLTYQPDNSGDHPGITPRFVFTAPLGPIEDDELRWYLEEYYIWPSDLFTERAERIATHFPHWGSLLFNATLGAPEARGVYEAWLSRSRNGGVFDRDRCRGALYFEAPLDGYILYRRREVKVYADEIAKAISGYRIPLVYLEACQSAKADENVTASVSAQLLQHGIGSVVAMTHNVLLETASRFTATFYGELARGACVGKAILAGQMALAQDTWRGRTLGTNDLHLNDWFVPVLYQQCDDQRLITHLPSAALRQVGAEQRTLALGELPPEPDQCFQGRSRELLALERLYASGAAYALVRGMGGEGKTTLAVEAARWLLRSGRFEQVAFVSLERVGGAAAVLETLWQQLLPNATKGNASPFKSLAEAMASVEKLLATRATLLVLDNAESVLPSKAGTFPEKEAGTLLETLTNLRRSVKLLFTSREQLPPPFDHPHRVIELGALEQCDAIALAARVMRQAEPEPAAKDPSEERTKITALVEAVGCHARALVLLAREVANQGVPVTTANVRALMAKLERKHPGERERSLYASIALSLRHLSVPLDEDANALAVFHRVVQKDTLALMLKDQKGAKTRALLTALEQVGLAKAGGFGHFRLDPALAPYLARDLDAEELEALGIRRADAMATLTTYLYEQQHKNPQLAAELSRLELPNLMGMLDWIMVRWPLERVVVLVDMVERLLLMSGMPPVFARAEKLFRTATETLEWSHACFLAERVLTDQLLVRGNVSAGLAAAERLQVKCDLAGESAYPEAAYDLAMVYLTVGRARRRVGDADAALLATDEARSRFKALAEAGDTAADRMVAAALASRVNCLVDLGRMDEAAQSLRRRHSLE